jgi:hypothetical protein
MRSTSASDRWKRRLAGVGSQIGQLMICPRRLKTCGRMLGMAVSMVAASLPGLKLNNVCPTM